MTANTSGIEFFRDIVSFSKYAKYLKDEQRRETTEETIDRNKAMHLKKFPHLKNQLDEAYGLIHDGYFVAIDINLLLKREFFLRNDECGPIVQIIFLLIR